MNGLESHNFYSTSPKLWSELSEGWYTKACGWRLPGAATLDFTPTAASDYSSKEEGMQTSSNTKPVATLQLSNILYILYVCCITACTSAPAHPFASWASLTIKKSDTMKRIGHWITKLYCVNCIQQLLPPVNLCSACSVQKITSSETFWRQRWSLAISVCFGVITVLTLFIRD